MRKLCILIGFAAAMVGCSKDSTPDPVPQPPARLRVLQADINGNTLGGNIGVSLQPEIKIIFSAAVDKASAANGITITNSSGAVVAATQSWQGTDSILLMRPDAKITGLSTHTVAIATSVKSAAGGLINQAYAASFISGIDSTFKFPVITNDSLLTLVQKQTFKYFWDFAHPVSGLARERNSSGETVTSGGSGFGLMAIVAGTNRGFITRQQALARFSTIVQFLKTKAQRFHGVWPHWLNGSTGAVIPFSAQDNGADLVETSFLAMGLMTVREYCNQNNSTENLIRQDINSLLDGIEWSWFRKNNEQVLYWHWSPTDGWAINLKINGWNECLITYVLAAGANQYSIPDTVYHQGYARNGQMVNGNTYYNTPLPLGPAQGGPLFFSHYSFLGINPNGLKDKYADYWQQNLAHSTINQRYCADNPKRYYGYSAATWGLTASDIPGGYTASSPENDRGVIAPTAAVSALPYTPVESMNALRFFYYVLGDKIWKDYGFADAFSLHENWFASSFLAIDQGPQIIMIENYRSGLLWQLLSNAPEVKRGLKKLGFTAPYL